jgi:cephalosporin hydroxylase
MGTAKKLKAELRNLRDLTYRRIRGSEEDIVNGFHVLYYGSNQTWQDTFWLGVKILKCPLDLWIYQEIIFKVHPDIIIETGTAQGGSALYLANLCDLLDHGIVITIDIENVGGRPQHKRITYLEGDSTSDKIVKMVERTISKDSRVLIILDSDHKKDHVLKEMEIYSKFVTKNSYLIVEDTNINNHPVNPNFGDGPMEAVEEFLKTDNSFIKDKCCEKFYLTFNPGGYLLKVS